MSKENKIKIAKFIGIILLMAVGIHIIYTCIQIAQLMDQRPTNSHFINMSQQAEIVDKSTDNNQNYYIIVKSINDDPTKYKVEVSSTEYSDLNINDKVFCTFYYDDQEFHMINISKARNIEKIK